MREQSFVKGLFAGLLEESLIFPWRELSTYEAARLHPLLDSVRTFFDREVDPARIDREGRIPDEVLAGLKELGCFGLLVPHAHGGMGLSSTGYARVVQEVSGIDASIAVTLGAHQSIGTNGLLLFGTAEQKSRYLPRLAKGELVSAFALSEEGAGSDAAAIQTRAERRPDGSYVLHGTKMWVANGGVADLFTVFARTSPSEDGVKPRITAFVVERAWGVVSGPSDAKLGIRGASTTRVSFDDVHVPAHNVLGEADRGFKVAVEVLNSGRLGLASGCVGICKRALKMAIERSRARRAFGRPIGEFGLIKDKIASMMSETWAVECTTYLTTGLVDAGARDFAVESAICKVFASEACWRVVNEALQIAAGIGYMADHPYERLLRDARVNLIFEGTNEVLRTFIALSGMQGPSGRIVDVAKALRNPLKGLALLGELAFHKARAPFGGGRLTRHHPVMNPQATVFEAYVRELASGVERVLRKHGRDVREMQYTQKRAADIAIDLYAVAACIARTTRAIERRGEEGATREIDLTRIFVADAERRLAFTVAAIDKNDDELRKSVATRAYADGAYPFDVV